MPKGVNSAEFFRDRIAASNAVFTYWVAHDEEHIFGWCWLQPCRNNPFSQSRMGEISTYVPQDANCDGVAHALIHHLIDHAQGTGVSCVVG